MNAAAEATLAEAAALLFRECDVLDDGDLDGWLALFTDDAVCHIPGDDPSADPRTTVAILYDDRRRMEDRVWRLRSGDAHAQIPPSRTCRFHANVRLAPSAVEGETVVRSRYVIEEARLGMRRTIAGRAEYRLRRVDGALKIARKTVVLVDAADPQLNLTLLI